MTAADWLTCADPERMLRLLLSQKQSERKWRLCAVACARRAPKVFPTEQQSDLLHVALLLADGKVTARDVDHTRSRCRTLEETALLGSAPVAADLVMAAARRASGRPGTAGYAHEQMAQAGLLREVFGNPLRACEYKAEWLQGHGGLVQALALGIYDDRTFHRIGYLADALEDEGATGELMEHLRQPGTHVRGCWALDLCMGRK